MIEELELQPVPRAQETLEGNENQFPDEQPSRIFTDSVKITCAGKLKALFLKPKDNLTPIPESHYKPVLNVFDGAWMKEFAIDDDGRLKSGTGHGRVFVKKLYWRPSELNGRPMVKQRRVGGDLTMGFLPPRSSREDYFRANNRDQMFLQLPLAPLVNDLEAAMRLHLPDYYEFHMYQASKLVRPPGEVLVKNPWKVGETQRNSQGKQGRNR